MGPCGRLFRAERAYAFYAASDKHVVVMADVWLNPVADQVHICPNPIAMPVGARELLVVGTTRSGVHPELVVQRRVTYAFAADATPKAVVLYSMGVDAPVRQELAVGATAPPPLAPPSTAAPPTSAPPAPAAAHPGGPVEVTGYSATFSLEEALQDALAQAVARFPSPPRNPDVAVSIDVKDISARAHGNIRPGLFVRVVATS